MQVCTYLLKCHFKIKITEQFLQKSSKQPASNKKHLICMYNNNYEMSSSSYPLHNCLWFKKTHTKPQAAFYGTATMENGNQSNVFILSIFLIPHKKIFKKSCIIISILANLSKKRISPHPTTTYTQKGISYSSQADTRPPTKFLFASNLRI